MSSLLSRRLKHPGQIGALPSGPNLPMGMYQPRRKNTEKQARRLSPSEVAEPLQERHVRVRVQPLRYSIRYGLGDEGKHKSYCGTGFSSEKSKPFIARYFTAANILNHANGGKNHCCDSRQ